MSRLSLIVIIGAFLVGGIGLYALVQQSSSAEIRACEERCRAAGKSAVVAPAGTVGRFIDGSQNPTDGAAFCTCGNSATGGGLSAVVK